VHKVLSSYDVLGTGNLYVVLYTQKFHDENPRTYKAFYRALSEAASIINRDKNAAAETYIRVEKAAFIWYTKLLTILK
jgi:NitT/TauT family transport system substrate-binding protein